MQNLKKDREMIALNEGLYNEFYVQELEARLETDPLMTGGLVDFLSSNNADLQSASCICIQFGCGGTNNCEQTLS